MTHTYPFPEPVILDAEVFTELPAALRRTGQPSYWAEKNRRGAPADSFLEGPSFDAQGNLWFVDIPFGRVFRADQGGDDAALDLDVVDIDGGEPTEGALDVGGDEDRVGLGHPGLPRDVAERGA